MLYALISIASSGRSNEYTQYTIFNIKMKTTPNFPKSTATLREIISQTDLYLDFLQKRMFLKTKGLSISQFDQLFLSVYVFFQGIQERIQNSCGKRTIRVLATEGLLYI